MRHGAGCARRPRPCGDSLEGDAELEGDRGGHARVHGLVLAPHRERTTAVAPRRRRAGTRAQLVVEPDVDGAHVGVRRCSPTATVTHPARVPARPARACTRRRRRAPPAPSAGERLEQLALDLGDAVPAAEVLGVGQADVGDHADLRAGDRAQLGDVAGEAGAHLDHDDLGVVGGAEQRQRDPASLLNEPGLACTRRVGRERRRQ